MNSGRRLKLGTHELSAAEFDALADKLKLPESSAKKKTQTYGKNKKALFPGDVPAPEASQERAAAREAGE